MQASDAHLLGDISAFTGSPLGVFERAQGPGLELAEEVADPAGVVEPGLVAAGLVGGQAAGDGLAGDGAGPVQVGPVKGRRVGLASAVRLAAAHEAAGEGSGQGVVQAGELRGEPRPGRLWWSVGHWEGLLQRVAAFGCLPKDSIYCDAHKHPVARSVLMSQSNQEDDFALVSRALGGLPIINQVLDL